MKKVIAFLLAILLIISASACIADNSGNSPSEDKRGKSEEIIDDDKESEAAGNDAARENEKDTETGENGNTGDTAEAGNAESIDEHGTYTTKNDVALYIYTYGHLPENFITKKEAQSLGWSGGSLEPYAPGKCIGGSYFGNYEGSLPEADGRKYTECDIDTLGASSRGAKRIVFSNDGLIYYTEDHYETFELLYGEE